jgi:hypothetical protein
MTARVKAPFMPFPNRQVAAWVAAAQAIVLAGGKVELTEVGVQQARGIDGWHVNLQGVNLKSGRGRTLRDRAMAVAETIGWELAESGAFPAYAPGSGSDEGLHDYIVDLLTEHATIAQGIAKKLTASATKIDGEELAARLAPVLRAR